MLDRVPKPWRWTLGLHECGIEATAWVGCKPYRDERRMMVYRKVITRGGATLEEAFENMLKGIEAFGTTDPFWSHV